MKRHAVLRGAKSSPAGLAFLAGVALFAAVLAGCRLGSGGRASADTNAWAAPPPPRGAVESYADVVEHVAPAVVTIRSERVVRAPRQHPFLDDPLFRQFFGAPDESQAPPSVEHALGSGVIARSDGYVVTNHHVVDGAEDIRVELADRRTFPAKLVGSDAPSDLAVLKISGSNLPSLALGNSDAVRVGDVVLAIGNPLGVGQTVTSGIVSAKGRSTGLSDGSFQDFIQTDASINRGNSGGALVDTRGDWIGINSQILSTSGGSMGIGFAIPSNMARAVFDQLVRGEPVRRGLLGVTIQPVTADLAASLGLRDARGVIVNSVAPGSAAAKAGIVRGDVILAMNGQPVNDNNALRNRIAATRPGSMVTLDVVRDGQRRSVRVTLGELQTERAAAAEPADEEGAPEPAAGLLGVTVEPLTGSLAQEVGVRPGTRGLVVTGVDPVGPAAQGGIEEGDVIQQVDRHAVATATELRSAVERARGRPALLLVQRQDQTFFATVRPRG